ncbi:ABC-2 type transport system ATP-binding protein [Clostridium cavendishii DSM 21758]|uniref:ABC-2 type transport system ATP-binding protein n=1 Tax=Clostridium cavendishii DSM 21758 TaxID=1121302 RepID=A0A1M6SV42_9CLOT|nr:ABC transporter ATP-binding protein [Clostridium cavendishii]SHK48602.1 ABC-2 type transport system ATP-binding protein [Clostridium cavendishii DSM 21758]
MEYVITTHNLCKNFKNGAVLSNLNMKVKKGEIYGFLGENGSGKTTTIKLLVSLLKPTSGSIDLFGEDMTIDTFDKLKRIGSVIEYPAFYENLTARENLQLHKMIIGYDAPNCIDEVLNLVKLKNHEGKKVKNFSLGMKQRLGIARAILHKPDLLLLDEPINGLDPIGIKDMRELLVTLSKKHGMTILISTHILNEIELMANTIGIIKNGSLIEEVNYETIKNQNLNALVITVDDANKACFILEEKLNIKNFKLCNENTLKVYERINDSALINKTLCLNDVFVESIVVKNNSLEDHFVSIIGGNKND